MVAETPRFDENGFGPGLRERPSVADGNPNVPAVMDDQRGNAGAAAIGTVYRRQGTARGITSTLTASPVGGR